MMSRVVIVLSVCLALATLSAAQRPFYAPNPWFDKYGPQQEQTSTTTTSSGSTSNTSNTVDPLGDRFLVPVENNVSFRYYNNVPIEGPGTPCVGCVYRLTRNGFVMVRL
ncbi:uncharacterized protein LOC132205599 [Neocloeon triangulifer]|uniref:uncharacterized protein LOC132205599 n=1 Tax=Neocloeon triangulifer TaxID=2078957 RepID=UPI00286F28E2|nr:uncharacterized protein LOC132205599 [Neocloeon triangulifer]